MGPGLKLHQESVRLEPRGRGLHDVTDAVRRVVSAAGVRTGLCNVCVQHTSASLVVQENADPAVRRDLEAFLARLAPEGAGYEHEEEGSDDMPSHIRAALTRTAETLPVSGGDLALGTWQALYLWEHRRAPHRRTLVVTVWGE
jgi:secondary thiamine-phosphate synthase enzyme